MCKGMYKVMDTVLAETYITGTLEECKSFLRKVNRSHLEHLDIVSIDSGRCISWTL